LRAAQGSSAGGTEEPDSFAVFRFGTVGVVSMVERRKTPRKAAKRRSSRTSTAKKSSAKSGTPKRWSQRVTQESDALDLKRGVFKLTDPKKIRVPQALGGAQLSPQKRRLSLRAFDADILHQPVRQDLAQDPTRSAGAGEGRTEASIWPGLNSRLPERATLPVPAPRSCPNPDGRDQPEKPATPGSGGADSGKARLPAKLSIPQRDELPGCKVPFASF
jgi:hypothetical protein